ncbi:MAG: hypothetical protein Q8L64_01565, partial [bacterium]|nr:hypothetical protein [bacterium]
DNPHPNWTVTIYEMEVYGPPPSLKITQPADNSQFNFGESINFVGEKIGDIINLRWSSSIDGVFGTDTLNIVKNNLSPGTHTITLSGQGGTPPVASVGKGGNPGAAIRAQTIGNFSHSITIFVKSGNPKVVMLDFLSGGNHNRIYDRKGDLAAKDIGKQDKFLDPIQWQGKISGNDITDVYCWPLSYVRSGANFVGNGPSKLKFNAHFIDLFQSPSLTFDVALTGTLRDENNVIQQNFTFNTQTVTTSGDLVVAKEFQSVEGLPAVVGIWNLELNWSFSKGATFFGSQRTPQSGYQTIYTTWEKPLYSGNFGLSKGWVEKLPTYYLEIIQISCDYAKNSGAVNSEENIMQTIYDRCWSQNTYSYSKEIPDDLSKRGLDRLLEESYRNGWCGEWASFLQSLLEVQGIDVLYRGYEIKPKYYPAMVLLTSIDLPVVGNITPRMFPYNPPQEDWSFTNHAIILSKTSFFRTYDPTFHTTPTEFSSSVNNLFDVFDNNERRVISLNPAPEYIETQKPPAINWE